MKKINYKKIIFYISIFLSILCFSLFVNIYFEDIYYLKYETNFQEEFEINQTKNLISFYFYKNDLNEIWTNKEKFHFGEIRIIFNYLLVFFVFFLGYIFWYFRKKYKFNKNIFFKNIFIYTTINILILIFYNFFWHKILHPLFFNNNLWINYPTEISYYLFNKIFFIKTIILIWFIFVFINLIFYYFYGKRKI